MRDTVSGSPVRALVADDHPVFRKGLSRFLAASGGIEVVGEAATGPQALELILRHEPDVALLDLQMPGLDGAQVAAAVRDEGLTTRVLIVSAYDDPAHVYDALAQGAAGFVHKEAPPDEIIAGVLACAAGRDVVSPRLAPGLAAEIRQRAESPRPELTGRELEVLRLLADGASGPAIAKELNLSPSTVKTYVQRLCEKLGVTGQAAAVAEAMRRGLLE